MKITKIKVDRLAVDLVHPYHLSKEYGIFSTATPVAVTMYTDGDVLLWNAMRSGTFVLPFLPAKNGLQKGWGKAIIQGTVL